jgi:hypothetical protein
MIAFFSELALVNKCHNITWGKGTSKFAPVLNKHNTIKTYGWAGVELHRFITSALDWGECSASCLGRFNPPPRKDLHYPLDRSWLGLPVLDAVQKRKISDLAWNQSSISRLSTSYPAHYIGWPTMDDILRYCHVSGVLWQIITGSELDDWIYWHFCYNYKQL